MQQEIETLGRFADAAIAFGVAYGFQILGALVFLLVGLKVSAWLAARTFILLSRRNIDPTLSKFAASAVRVLLIGFLIIATLGNFGVSIAPLIALAGAAAFGASVALQGPLSNYGAGLSIILTRPFTVGDTITVQGVSGVVDEITLAATNLDGEDGQRITIPNRQIVGQILVNSRSWRIVETRLCIDYAADPEAAATAIGRALASVANVSDEWPPQVGIQDFGYAGLLIGLRYWVPSRKYFATRYAANAAIRAALADAGITLLPLARAAILTDPAQDMARPLPDPETSPV